MKQELMADSAPGQRHSGSHTFGRPKERPILFSGPMVRALLAGRKTQTRRVVKPQLTLCVGHAPSWKAHTPDGWWCSTCGEGAWHRQWRGIACPYGEPGDVLWVKETFKPHSTFAHLKPSEIPDSKIFYAADQAYAPSNTKWWPSLFMQRRFSRLSLRITDVRVERLNDCPSADAVAEGIEPSPDDPGLWLEYGAPSWDDKGVWLEDPRRSYAALWDQINGPGAWAANPWVWAVSFEVVTTRSTVSESTARCEVNVLNPKRDPL